MLPATGGRFDARLLEHDERRARFRLELGIPEASWEGQAEVSAADGDVRFDAWQGSGEPPAWLCQYVRAALRAAWRQHSAAGWPRRFTRWRDERALRSEGDGSGSE